MNWKSNRTKKVRILKMKKIKGTKDSQMKSEKITTKKRMKLTTILLKIKANRVKKIEVLNKN